MLATKSDIDTIASRLDVGLCGLCGDLRMRDRTHDNDDEGQVPGDVIAERLAFVRRDIGDLITEQRTQFAELDRRMQAMATEIRQIQIERSNEAGRVAGVKMTLSVIITMSTLLGGLVTWVVAHIPWGGKTP